MAAQASFPNNQAFGIPEAEVLNHNFLNSDMAEKNVSNPNHLVQPFRPEKPYFVNDFAEHLLGSWDGCGDLSCLSGQEDLFSFDSCRLHGNGDNTNLDPWVETSSASFGLPPKLQNDNPPLDVVPDPLAAEWSMLWEESLTDIPSSNAVPVAASGNSYQPTPGLTECSTPASLSAPNSFRDPTNGSLGCFVTENQRWHATLSRSRAADRFFLYAVLTTKIFCRPSCASRRPSRRHVRFFSFPGAIEAAEQAKFQPCKRCKPKILGTGNTGVLAVSQVLCRIVSETFEKGSEAKKENLKLEYLAVSAGLSIFHFHRLFKATTQVTPADFITACHALALQDALCTYSKRGSKPIPSAVQLSPRWSERTARKALGGLSAEEYANGARSKSIEYCSVSAPVGDLGIACSRGKKSPNLDVHAIVLLQDSSLQLDNHFSTSRLPEEQTRRVQQCIKELKEKCEDRDVELATDVLSVLWRARLWLKLTHDYGLE